MKKRFHIFVTLLVFSVTALFTGNVFAGNITEQTVSFQSGADTVSAFIARPEGDGPYPALIVIHEWWGLNDWVMENSREFAEKGYVALAVDLYRGKVADDPDFAHELSRALPQDRALRDMMAAIDYLRRQHFVIDNKIGSIGWCMGSGYSLQLALNADTAATVVAYGRLVTDTEVNDYKGVRSQHLTKNDFSIRENRNLLSGFTKLVSDTPAYKIKSSLSTFFNDTLAFYI